MGIPGAAIGYCQALFNRAGPADEHTRHVVRLLDEIEAPWSRSHEMFWGYRNQREDAAAFIDGGMLPLRSNGRVPILITGLDPGLDEQVVMEIFRHPPSVASGETVLVRVVLRNEVSVLGAARMLRSVFASAIATGTMPAWWLLLQGELDVGQWMALRRELGSLWSYVNIAVNPFTPSDVLATVADQITVAQIPIGLASGVRGDGTIALAPGMKISGAQDCGAYSLPCYLENLGALPVVPTLIILGPSMPSWSDAQNQGRIRALLPQLQGGCELLWRDLAPSRRRMVWNLSA